MSLVTLTQNPHGRIEGFLGPLGVDGVLLETRFGTLDCNHQVCFQNLTGGPRSREMVEKAQQNPVAGEGSEGMRGGKRGSEMAVLAEEFTYEEE